MDSITDIRPSPLAGRWYPADPQVLAERIDQYLAAADTPPLPGEIIGLVTPHAGHRFSGPVAGHAFATLKGSQPEVVVILSPMHQPYAAPILTTKHQAYHTPLGDIPVDEQGIALLKESLQGKTGVEVVPIQRDTEHAVEIELPFLQRVLSPGYSLLPLMIRDQDQDLMRAVGDGLCELLTTTEGLLIASTDLSHFYPAEKARALDQTIIDHILALDPEGIYQAEEQGKGYACGKGGLAAVMWAAKCLGATSAHHLQYGHSGEITGDMTRVVGYEAAAFTKE